jgi:hypothetical protein
MHNEITVLVIASVLYKCGHFRGLELFRPVLAFFERPDNILGNF